MTKKAEDKLVVKIGSPFAVGANNCAAAEWGVF